MEKKYRIPSLLRGMKVVEYIINQEQDATFAEISEKFSIPKTTLFRILSTLIEKNWIEKHGDTYRSGYRLLQLGMRALSKMELRQVAIPYLHLLGQQTGETAHLGILSEKRCLIIAVCDGPRHIKISSRPGTLTALHCSAPGKVLLSFCIGDNLEAFLNGEHLEKRTPNTITDIQALKQESQTIVRQGYAVDNREYYQDVRCVAAPIKNADGSVIAAIGITAPAVNLPQEMTAETAMKVIEVANMISRDLGHHHDF